MRRTPLNGVAHQWRVLPPAPPSLAQKLGIPLLWATLLAHRGGATPGEARALMESPRPTDPFLLPGVERAVHRLLRAVMAGETVAVFGDFDADGVTGTAILYLGLTGLGARVVPYIPHRVQEGHGLNAPALRHLQQQGATLLVTVDCGISSPREVALARSLGLEVVVTDHHTPPGGAFPAVVVSPWAEGTPPTFHHLTGAGLALKLVQALYHALGREVSPALLALSAIGTVADVAPLVGENRWLVRRGLEALSGQGLPPGLRALLASASVEPGEVGTEEVAFYLAPRINASGRLALATTSLRLLTTDSEEEARALARELERLNSRRQRLTEEALQRALPEASNQARRQALVFIADGALNPGVAGLVAGKLAEALYRPVVVACTGGDVVRASARSIPEFNIIQALRSLKAPFIRLGGHPEAAGFVLAPEHLEGVRTGLQALARERLQGVPLTPTLAIDAEVRLTQLLGTTYHFIRGLEPFGPGNPQPLFLTRRLEVLSARSVGQRGEHLVLKLKGDGAVWDAVVFNAGQPPAGGLVDAVYTLRGDRFRGEERVRLQVVGLRPAR